jgi:hypothetical protein
MKVSKLKNEETLLGRSYPLKASNGALSSCITDGVTYDNLPATLFEHI